MTLKSKLVPFFAAGALVSSFAARAQTAGDSSTGSATSPNPDSGSSVTGQAPGTQSSSPTGNPTGPTGATTPSAPGSSNQSSSSSAGTPGTSGDSTSTPAQGSSTTSSPAPSMSPDSGSDSK